MGSTEEDTDRMIERFDSWDYNNQRNFLIRAQDRAYQNAGMRADGCSSCPYIKEGAEFCATLCASLGIDKKRVPGYERIGKLIDELTTRGEKTKLSDLMEAA